MTGMAMEMTGAKPALWAGLGCCFNEDSCRVIITILL
jgi:hypothetical protein